MDDLERKFGRYAIPHLLLWVAILNGLTFVLCTFNPGFRDAVRLDPVALMSGQVWRVVTQAFVPSVGGILPDWVAVIFYLMFLTWIGEGLERAMGRVRLNLFYGLGLLASAAGALISGQGEMGFLLNNTLIFAFAFFYPDMSVLAFMIIPVRIVWLAALDALYVVILFFSAGWRGRLGILVAMAQFFGMFGPALWRGFIAWRRRGAGGREAGRAEVLSEAFHCCSHCGRTDRTNPELDFRVAGDGAEYCGEHLPRRGGGAVS
jgi:hypothetical protein